MRRHCRAVLSRHLLHGRTALSAARKRGRPPKAEVASYADLGPRIRHEALPGASTARVVSTYRPDPEAPSAPAIRGARAVIIYEWLHAQGLLSDPQREAADRYLVQLERASGAVEGRPDASGVRSNAVMGPSDRQVAALADLRLADEALAEDRDLVRGIVGWNCEPPEGVPLVRFRAALQRVADVWGMD